MKKRLSEKLDSGIHALTGGRGITVVLVPGWPETAETYSEVFPLLAKNHSAIAVDQPKPGDSTPFEAGYNTGAISRTLDTSLRSRTQKGFHLVGRDVGACIGYAWAVQFPDRVKSLTLLDSALPRLVRPRNCPVPFEVKLKLWQFSFNSIPELPELLTEDRERVFIEWFFRNKAVHLERIPAENREAYVQCYSKPGGMSQGFAYYRAATQSASPNVEFSKHKLEMPVLALGGSGAQSDNLRISMETLPSNVPGGVIEDCGHYVMEEQPEVLAHRRLDFIKHVEGPALLKPFLLSSVIGCAVGLLYAELRVKNPAPPLVGSRSARCLGPWANSVLCQPLSRVRGARSSSRIQAGCARAMDTRPAPRYRRSGLNRKRKSINRKLASI
jgi:pimeloyl-ACP methyl ester carboxylesterase